MSMTGYELGGQYKTYDNVILEVDADGNRHVRFRPTHANETKQVMEQPELAYWDARNNANIKRLLLIPCVILDFCVLTRFVTEMAECHVSFRFCCFIKMDMMQESMCPLRNKSIIIRLTILSKAEICKILPDVGPTTVEAVLGATVKTGSVKRIGVSRAARYIKANFIVV